MENKSSTDFDCLVTIYKVKERFVYNVACNIYHMPIYKEITSEDKFLIGENYYNIYYISSHMSDYKKSLFRESNFKYNKDFETYYSFINKLKKDIKIKNHKYFDLHKGNFMKDKRGTLIFINPILKRIEENEENNN